MGDSSAAVADASATDLFDRYTLPKVALVVILLASLVGTWVTTGLNGGPGVITVVGKWVYFVSLGVLTGGLVWKHGFVSPTDIGTEAAEYCGAMYARFDRIAGGALAGLALGAPVVLAGYGRAFDGGWLPTALGATLLLFGLLAARNAWQSAGVDRQFRGVPGLLALALALSLVVLTAVAEVAVRGAGPTAVAVRVLHLLAFSLWVGGAVWNIFVAVPEGQRRPTVAVVRAAGQQLERFRWVVRGIIPTLLLTGLYQAVDAFGLSADAYLGSALGIAVLAKVGFIGALGVIFKLCPMWRACSPIDGVCELDDLESAPQSDRAGEGGDD